ncbi:hypothetical protein SAY87_023388 [Trapa incisa]|uniref:Uncharacterized protein n=1 Tax=Trapa incisa TaxID=236973 RepID=A0AAN7QR25_9MYRT|nr:hypothetical protein SAY87_023388 [Trapa incisa]
MDLELQESDIIFSSMWSSGELLDRYGMPPVVVVVDESACDHKSTSRNTTGKEMVFRTVPIDIPCRLRHQKWKSAGSRSSASRGHRFQGYEGGEDDEDGEMEPPHVIMGRRIAGKVTFSVCTGMGRTLKGRDLREVRNSILKLTGFLES